MTNDLPSFCRLSSRLDRSRHLVAPFERAPSRLAAQERTTIANKKPLARSIFPRWLDQPHVSSSNRFGGETRPRMCGKCIHNRLAVSAFAQAGHLTDIAERIESDPICIIGHIS